MWSGRADESVLAVSRTRSTRRKPLTAADREAIAGRARGFLVEKYGLDEAASERLGSVAVLWRRRRGRAAGSVGPQRTDHARAAASLRRLLGIVSTDAVGGGGSSVASEPGNAPGIHPATRGEYRVGQRWGGWDSNPDGDHPSGV